MDLTHVLDFVVLVPWTRTPWTSTLPTTSA